MLICNLLEQHSPKKHQYSVSMRPTTGKTVRSRGITPPPSSPVESLSRLKDQVSGRVSVMAKLRGAMQRFPSFKKREDMDDEEKHLNSLQVGDHDEYCKKPNCEARQPGYKIPSIFEKVAPMSSAGDDKEIDDDEIMMEQGESDEDGSGEEHVEGDEDIDFEEENYEVVEPREMC